MNWFGRKKESQQPSAVSSTSKPAAGGGTNTRAKTANTVVSLRENIATQEKREQHLEKKIDLCVKEAKEKMAKKDKKGELYSLKVYFCTYSIFNLMQMRVHLAQVLSSN
jgi:hypothetical protein